MWYTLLIFALVMTCCVGVHEFGHYVAAKSVGMYVHEFSIGFGPKLFSVRPKETKFVARLLPFGGYVILPTEQLEDFDPVPAGRSFYDKSPWQRLWVMVAGATFNILLALCVIGGLFYSQGHYDLSSSKVQVIQGLPAEQAGLQSGDQLVRLNDQKIENWSQIADYMKTNPTQLQVQFVREDNVSTLEIRPVLQEGQAVLGVQPFLIRSGFFSSMWKGVQTLFLMTSQMIQGLVHMVCHPSTIQVGGPVTIAKMSAQAANQGWITLLTYVALFNLNLGVLNLIPFPGLDGAKALTTFIEGLCGRAIPRKIENAIHLVGLTILMVLMVWLTGYELLGLVR